jgi:hypothetical protein
MTQEELLEQMYGILDDWKAQRFGGEPIVEAIEKLAAVSGGTRRDELDVLVDGMRNLAAALVEQQVISAAELTTALQALVATTSGGVGGSDDTTGNESDQIRQNVAELSRRMGPKLGTLDEPVTIGDPAAATLSKVDPILPVPLLPGGAATLHGAGLSAVTGIRVDGTAVIVERVLAGEVDFTAPRDLVPDSTVEVIAFLPDNQALAVDVAVGAGQTTGQQSNKGVKS